MDKSECGKVVALLTTGWNKPTDRESLRNRQEAFWEMIRDLDYQEVRDSVTDLMLYAKWMPTPGELRITVLLDKLPGGRPPPAIEAWGELRRRSDNSHSGISNTKPHPVLGAAMRKLGREATELKTNADREMFFSLYRETLGRYVLKHFPIDRSGNE